MTYAVDALLTWQAFTFLWRLKRVEYALTGVWEKQGVTARHQLLRRQHRQLPYPRHHMASA